MPNNKWHVAPGIRQLEDARVTCGDIDALASVGYTVTVAQEQAGTRPQPVDYPAAANNWYYFYGQRIAPTP